MCRRVQSWNYQNAERWQPDLEIWKGYEKQNEKLFLSAAKRQKSTNADEAPETFLGKSCAKQKLVSYTGGWKSGGSDSLMACGRSEEDCDGESLEPRNRGGDWNCWRGFCYVREYGAVRWIWNVVGGDGKVRHDRVCLLARLMRSCWMWGECSSRWWGFGAARRWVRSVKTGS